MRSDGSFFCDLPNIRQNIVGEFETAKKSVDNFDKNHFSYLHKKIFDLYCMIDTIFSTLTEQIIF